jgi:hypothetical protein
MFVPGSTKTMTLVSVVSALVRGFVVALQEPLSNEHGQRPLNLQPWVVQMIILWIACLGIPFVIGSDQWPRYSVITLLKSGMPFILALTLSQLIWFPKGHQNEVTAMTTTTSVEANATQTRIQSGVDFCGRLLYYFLPISKSKPVPTWSRWFRMNLEFLFWIGIKMIVYAVVLQWMHQILAQQSDRSSTPMSSSLFTVFLVSRYAQLVTLYMIMYLTFCWVNDAVSCVVSILSLGYYEVITFSNYPVLSKSLKDFWGRNYNRVTHNLLKECVYIPACNYGGCTKRTARYLTFAVSGLIHVYTNYFVFGGGYWRTMAFFMLQPVWIDAEDYFAIPTGWSHLLFWLSSFLYLGLFVEVLPEYLEKSALKSVHPCIDSTATQILQWMNLSIHHILPLIGER